VHYPGDYNVMVRGHRDIAYRQDVLDKHHVDTQVISLTTPGTHVETPQVAIKLSAITNDAFARVRDERRGRFEPLATLPLCDPPASVTEFLRATNQLKLAGAMLFSNVNGTGLDDSTVLAVVRSRERSRRRHDDSPDVSRRRRSHA
jgi:predicted TIM-barrel fold metal-dependent hydrolase